MTDETDDAETEEAPERKHAIEGGTAFVDKLAAEPEEDDDDE